MKPFVQMVNGRLRRLPTWPVYLAGAVPGFVYYYWAITNQLGADPLLALERQLGDWALQALILTLLVTPLRLITGVSLLKFRRAFGLLAFFYVCLHLVTWLAFYKQFLWLEILADLYKRPYIIIGTISFVCLIPMALTSNAWSVRRLGPVKWANLHKLGYIAVILGAVHFLILVKAWPTRPVLYVLGVVFLVLCRINWRRILKIRNRFG